MYVEKLSWSLNGKNFPEAVKMLKITIFQRKHARCARICLSHDTIPSLRLSQPPPPLHLPSPSYTTYLIRWTLMDFVNSGSVRQMWAQVLRQEQGSPVYREYPVHSRIGLSGDRQGCSNPALGLTKYVLWLVVFFPSNLALARLEHEAWSKRNCKSHVGINIYSDWWC